MTATDELRRLLDERGVEWRYGDGTVSFSDGKHWFHAWAYNDGAMCVSMGYFTPEQAIEATLGNDGAGRTDDGVAERGTCSRESRRPMAEYVYGTDGHEGHWLTGEEIVRCRDCSKWSSFDTEDGKRIGDCSEWTHLDGFSHATDEDGFCAWASRRESE